MDLDKGSVLLYGLIGHPVKHSYSGPMHEAAFRDCGIAARYELFEVPPERLGDFFLKTIRERQVRGFNVTVPHKAAVIAHLTASVSPIVKMTGAVNTVRVETDGTLSGFNTDEPGFGRDLKEKGIALAGRDVVLLGAGGAASAVAIALAALNVRSIEVTDIVREKAECLAQNIKRHYPAVDARPVAEVSRLKIEEAGLLVNATPVGMKPGDPVLVEAQRLHPGLFVYDLIYNPAQTPLLKAAQERKCRWANGLGMLLHQGRLAFELWTGREAPVASMRWALEMSVYG